MADTNDFSFNPFVGPHPIETGRNIFGRNREIDDLYYLLSAERIVMLHSPSGAGKTSLIQAGLIPRLNERFDVWGPTRVNQLPSANSPATVNRYIRSAVLGFEQQIPAELRRTEDQLSTMTLAEYAASRREESKNIVLIFDQFEEILTADPLAIDAKREFFKQLGELLLDPRIWALFAMREDYLPALDPYAEQVPTHLKNWFRLDLLRRDKATEAIDETAKEGGRQFDSDAVTELVKDLATMQVQQPDGKFVPKEGLYVEPLQLQVVCRRLWERMPADKQTIDLAEIEQSGDVTTALADYYAAEVARLANGDVRIERNLREWVGERLITPDGIRSQVLRGAGSSEGLDNELIASLVNTHLVRGEQREGATWYELAHDRLIEPTRNNNRDWFDTHLHKVQKLASLWGKESRPDGLLLLGADLIEANRWAEQNEASLTETERRFLKASAARQQAVDKEKKQAKRLRRFAAGLFVMVLIVVVAAVAAYTQYRFAERNLTQSRNLLYFSNQLLAWNAFEQKNYSRSNDFLEASLPQPGTRHVDDLRSFDWFYLWREMHDEKQTLRGHAAGVTSVSFSPDGQTLASGSDDGTVKLWDLMSGQEKMTMKGRDSSVKSVSFSPDGRTLASGNGDWTVTLWDVANGQQKRTLKSHTASVLSVSFSPNGRILASGSDDGTVKLWDAVSGQEYMTLVSHANVFSVSFSPDGQTLASGGSDGIVRLWDWVNGRERARLDSRHAKGVKSVSFSPDGRTLASGNWDGTVKLWDVLSGQEIAMLKHVYRVTSVSFSLDGSTLASGDLGGAVKLWDVRKGQEKATLKGLPTVSIQFCFRHIVKR